MTNMDKFYADVQKIKKYDRANNAKYDGIRASKSVASLFETRTRSFGDLGISISQYWMQHYIENTKEPDNEPTDAHVQWLMTVLSYFDGELDSEHDLPKKDWKAISEFINYEAETLPINILTELMGVLVEKKVL